MLALLSKTTSSRGISKDTKISAAGVTLVQKVLHEFIFAKGTIGKKNCFKINSECQCGKNVTAYKKIRTLIQLLIIFSPIHSS